MNTWLDEVKFDAQGLIPVIAQDATTGRVLMFAWMDREALQETVKRGQAVYYSRSRQRLWPKGESSGHVQHVREIRLDCDNDVILLQIDQTGGIACHTGRESCFFRQLNSGDWTTTDPVLKNPETIYGQPATPLPETPARPAPAASILDALGQIIRQRRQANDDSSYVASLYRKGLNKILEKVGEEATETVIAAKDVQPDGTGQDDLIYETADLWFHTLVMLGNYDIPPDAVLNELARRFGLSGLEEKAARPAASSLN